MIFIFSPTTNDLGKVKPRASAPVLPEVGLVFITFAAASAAVESVVVIAVVSKAMLLPTTPPALTNTLVTSVAPA